MCCDHPYPDLCELLGQHIHGRMLHHWNASRRYRALWCELAGLDLEEMERRYPPTQPDGREPSLGTSRILQRNAGRNVVNRHTRSSGVGTCLKKLLKQKYNISSKSGCSCNRRALEMDRKGIAWCEENKETVVGWLKEGAAQRVWLRPILSLFGGTTEKMAMRLVEEAIQLAKDEEKNAIVVCGSTGIEQPVRPFSNRRSRPKDNWYSAFQQRCRYFGQQLRDEPGTNGTIPIYQCWAKSVDQQALCVETEAIKERLNDDDLRNRITACNTCALYQKTPRYVSQKQFGTDIQRLLSRLPPGITKIAGIARSGLSVATMLAKYLHVPIDIIRQMQGDVIEGGNGWRLNEGAPRNQGTVLVVDDTCMTGNSLKAVTPLVQKHYECEVRFATVYVNPLAKRKPDYWAVDLPHPHVLEWNVFNSVLTPACAFDIDGILCHECPPEDDDDGNRYLEFLEKTRPRYFVRKRPISLIVTARLDKYRPQTLAWLKRWGMNCSRLVMGPWASKAERLEADVAAFKARSFQEFMKGRFRPGPPMYVENDPHQAQRIAKLSGGIVVCPAAERCFP